MGVSFKQASAGKKFILTEYGFEQPRIKAKFDSETSKKRYEKSVPLSWVMRGYVTEVDKEA